MPNHNQILMNYNFRISAMGLEFRASKIRNIEREVEVEAIREGGCNGHVRALVKAPAEPKRLVFERGCGTGAEISKLSMLLGVPQPEPMVITVYDRANKHIRKAYLVTGWMLVKWQLGELDAVSGNVLLETVEAVYETLTELV